MNIPPASGSPDDNSAMINQIDDFIAKLNPPPGTTVATAIVTRTVGASATPANNIVPPETEEDIEKFVLNHSAQLVESSVKSIQELQKLTVATGDAEMMAGLASLISASTAAIETVNKIHLLNRKAKINREMKQIDIESKKELQRLKNDGYLNLPAGNTNILVATREEIIEQLTGKVKKKTEVIEIDITSTPSLSGDGIVVPV